MLIHAVMGAMFLFYAIYFICTGVIPFVAPITLYWVIKIEGVAEVATIIAMFSFGWGIKFEEWVRRNLRSPYFLKDSVGAILLPMFLGVPIIFAIKLWFNL